MFKKVKSKSIQRARHAARKEDNWNSYIILEVMGTAVWKRNGRRTWTHNVRMGGSWIGLRIGVRDVLFGTKVLNLPVPRPETELHEYLFVLQDSSRHTCYDILTGESRCQWLGAGSIAKSPRVTPQQANCPLYWFCFSPGVDAVAHSAASRAEAFRPAGLLVDT